MVRPVLTISLYFQSPDLAAMASEPRADLRQRQVKDAHRGDIMHGRGERVVGTTLIDVGVGSAQCSHDAADSAKIAPVLMTSLTFLWSGCRAGYHHATAEMVVSAPEPPRQPHASDRSACIRPLLPGR